MPLLNFVIMYDKIIKLSFKEEYLMEINDILEKFSFKGELEECNVFGSGHINTTYLAKYIENGKEKKYVVQKVNTNIFPDIDSLMNNVFSVTEFLRKKIIENGGNPHRETLHFIRTKSGDKYYTDANGSFYRMYIFVDNSICYNTVENSQLFKSSGIAFGRFQKRLAGFDASTLYETIPNFHNTQWRYINEFLKAVDEDKAGRVSTCTDEIKFVKDRKDDTGVLTSLIDEGKLPLRVTHNDTKLNNVMFDKTTNECICVIDLDTVMPGLALYDFGDSIRFGANTAAEDEADLSKVSLNLEYFRAYAEGFLSEAGSSLNQCELDKLAFSAKIMTFECGMRFLTDYLNGDVYFKTAYPEHNLVRAKNQFKLVADMEDKMDEMNNIIKDICNQ